MGLRHLLHVKSSATASTSPYVGNPKMPTASDIEYGEIALNYLKGAESAFIKNSSNEIVKLNDVSTITSGTTKLGDVLDGHLNKIITSVTLNTVGQTITTSDSGASLALTVSASDGLTTDKNTIKHSSKAATTSGFVKVEFDTYGHVTSSTAVTDADINGLVGTRYVYVSGDTMTGKLNINNGGLAVSGATSLNGNVTVTGTVTSSGAMYSSDRRLKENINEISCDAIDKVSKVDLKSYNFIADENKTVKYGVIAQELEEVGLNELVGEHDGRKGVDYIAFLVLKIAQLEKEIEELKKK